jgi:hypothetical protein
VLQLFTEPFKILCNINRSGGKEKMVQFITDINSTINGFVWGLPMMILILGVGVYLSIRCGFPQFCHFGHIMKNTLGKAFEKTEKKETRSISWESDWQYSCR